MRKYSTDLGSFFCDTQRREKDPEAGSQKGEGVVEGGGEVVVGG